MYTINKYIDNRDINGVTNDQLFINSVFTIYTI